MQKKVFVKKKKINPYVYCVNMHRRLLQQEVAIAHSHSGIFESLNIWLFMYNLSTVRRTFCFSVRSLLKVGYRARRVVSALFHGE